MNNIQSRDAISTQRKPFAPSAEQGHAKRLLQSADARANSIDGEFALRRSLSEAPFMSNVSKEVEVVPIQHRRLPINRHVFTKMNTSVDFLDAEYPEFSF
jgi:hypothetical protein